MSYRRQSAMNSFADQPSDALTVGRGAREQGLDRAELLEQARFVHDELAYHAGAHAPSGFRTAVVHSEEGRNLGSRVRALASHGRASVS
jgi:hypothetical protein